MALPPQTDKAFLREVDEEYRRDQLVGVWQRWGRWMIAGAVLLLALLAGYLYWRHHRAEQSAAQGERLQDAYDALGRNQPAAAAAPLAELAGSGRDGYRALARFTQGDVLLQKNDLRGAAAKFAEVAGDDGVARPFRDLALIRQTAAEYDTLKPQVVVERLRPLAVKGGPWFGSAGEMVAIAHVRQGRRDLAAQLFGQIASDEQTPDTIRQRSVQMAGALGAGAAGTNEDVKAK